MLHPDIGIDDTLHAFRKLFGDGTSRIDIVRHELRVEVHVPVQACGNDHGQIVSADIVYGSSLAAGGREIIEFRHICSGDIRMVVALHDIVHQFAGYGDFRLRSFAQGNPDGVTQAVCQQGADAQGRFDASVFSVSGFRYTEMQRESHTFLLHDGCQQAYCLYHDHCIGCLDGNDYIREILLHADAQKLHTRFHHAFRCIAIARHDAVG